MKFRFHLKKKSISKDIYSKIYKPLGFIIENKSRAIDIDKNYITFVTCYPLEKDIDSIEELFDILKSISNSNKLNLRLCCEDNLVEVFD